MRSGVIAPRAIHKQGGVANAVYRFHCSQSRHIYVSLTETGDLIQEGRILNGRGSIIAFLDACETGSCLDARGMNRLQRTGTLPTVWIPHGQLRDI